MFLRNAPRQLFFGAIGVLVLVSAACGGGSKAASQTTTTTAASGSRGAALTAFRQCMASHGITLAQRPRTTSTTNGSEPAASDNGGGGFGGGFGGAGAGARFSQPPAGVDPTKYQAALQACQSLIPNPRSNAQTQSAFVAYVTCLKSHGVQTGDPSQGFQALNGVDRTTAAFQAANQVCRPLLPSRGPGSPTSTTTS
jgi:hypothetical protein